MARERTFTDARARNENQPAAAFSFFFIPGTLPGIRIRAEPRRPGNSRRYSKRTVLDVIGSSWRSTPVTFRGRVRNVSSSTVARTAVHLGRKFHLGIARKERSFAVQTSFDRQSRYDRWTAVKIGTRIHRAGRGTVSRGEKNREAPSPNAQRGSSVVRLG